MEVKLTPQRSDDTITVIREGHILTINGESYDFSSLNDGDSVVDVPCEFIVGPVSRKNGVLHLRMILPHGPNPGKEVAFPEALINPPDGKLAIFESKDIDDVDS